MPPGIGGSSLIDLPIDDPSVVLGVCYENETGPEATTVDTWVTGWALGAHCPLALRGPTPVTVTTYDPDPEMPWYAP